MSDTVDALLLDMLEWIGKTDRPYADVMDAWRTSCPRLPVWEEANDRRLVTQAQQAGGVPVVQLTASGRAYLDRHLRDHG
ncbi:D-3-phosphoglycerate dehydrogenase [Inquilinus ginsengisoli]|jgi:D-3-phosphoglycerate dehydrogenase|uniref:D-3-phosphoglycerate dehydrogenase n=1 Tax=Inquilinus ginsengisoli TaxID=363840 RepID=A0ABU1JW93_9PROT|nr:hypothetical protein [Inquilinus ginsengisoli]MDR6292878.1 D-3-phosphoglycerate dehydrogenase [Inquilinus ginsengisoli]